jgi:regulator of replication initiation timing
MNSVSLPQHPCLSSSKTQSTDSLQILGITRVLRDFLVDILPKDYPFSVDKTARRAENREPNFHIPFFEFRGEGPPPIDIGYIGDLYFDITPNAYALYAKGKKGWQQWSVTQAPWEVNHSLIRHPDFKDGGRFLYCRGPKFSWYSLSSVYSSWRDMSRSGIVGDGGRDGKMDLAGVLIAEMLKEEGRQQLGKRDRVGGDTKLSMAAIKRRKFVNEDGVDYSGSPSMAARDTTAPIATPSKSSSSTHVIGPPRIMRTCTASSHTVHHNVVKSEHPHYSVPPALSVSGIQNRPEMVVDENRQLRNELDCLKKEIHLLAAQNQRILEGNQNMETENKNLRDSADKNARQGAGDLQAVTSYTTGTQQQTLPPGLIAVFNDAYAEYLNRRKLDPSLCHLNLLTFGTLVEWCRSRPEAQC